MKKELRKDYAALCNSSTVEGSSELLFGDLSKLAKDISEANKLTKKVRPPHSTNSRGDKYGGRSSYGSSQGNRRFHPYSKEKPHDFLGKSRFSKQRKKKDCSLKVLLYRRHRKRGSLSLPYSLDRKRMARTAPFSFSKSLTNS